MADELKVSRTPVREALIRLSVEQLVELRPGKGFFVRQRLPQDDLHDLEVLFALLTAMMDRSIVFFTGEGLLNTVRMRTDSKQDDIFVQAMLIEGVYDRIIAPTGNLTATRLSRALTARTFARHKILKVPESRHAIISLFKKLIIEMESQDLASARTCMLEIYRIKEAILRDMHVA